MKKSKIHQAIITILEAPGSKKGYSMLRNCYAELGKIQESKAIEALIEEKFDTNHSTFDIRE